jgi:hypothetical protein
MPQKVIIGPLYAPHYTLSCNNAYYTEIETFEKMIEREICLNPDRIWRIWKKDSEYYIEYELGEDENEEIKKLVTQLPQGAVLDTDCTTINVDDTYWDVKTKCGISQIEYMVRRVLTYLRGSFNIECPVERVREIMNDFFKYDELVYNMYDFAEIVEADAGKYNNPVESCSLMVEIALLYLTAYDDNASWPESWTAGNLREIRKRIEKFMTTKDPSVFRGLRRELV